MNYQNTQEPQSLGPRFEDILFNLAGSKTDRFITLYERVDPEIVLPPFRLFREHKNFDNHK
jgi:hypothetical protein